jgi:WD40 repeat protein
MLSGSDDGSIKVWGLADMELCSNSTTADQGLLPSVTAAAAAGVDGFGGLRVETDDMREQLHAVHPHGLRSWDLERGQAGPWRRLADDGSQEGACAARQLSSPSADGGDAAWQGEQRWVAGSVGKIEALHTLTDHNKAVCALESHGNFIFSGSFDGTIRVWDRFTLSCTKILTGHQGGVCTMAVCSGRLVSGSSDIRVWNLETWTLERVLKGHSGGVNELAVADNKLLGGFDDALIRVWDTTTWEVERVLEGHVGAVYAIALDDARLYSASFDKCIRVWY